MQNDETSPPFPGGWSSGGPHHLYDQFSTRTFVTITLATTLLIGTLPGTGLAGAQDGTVEIVDPVGGEAWSGIHLVRWVDQFTAADRPVHWTLEYSLNLGASWNFIDGASGDYRTTTTPTEHTFPFDTRVYADTTTAMFRVTLTVTGSGTSTNFVYTTNAPLAFDNTDPVSSSSVTGSGGRDDWYVSKASVSLAATDATAGMGVISVRVDGGAWSAYDAPVVLAEGDHLVEYYATDRAGNSENAISTLRILVDTTAPGTSHVLQGVLGDENWWTSAVNVALLPTDATSGVYTTYARADGAPFQEITSGLLVTGDGDHVADYYGEDVAGNVEFANTVGFRIDATAPASLFEIGAPKSTDARGRQYLASGTPITLSATDATSGLRNIYASFDGAPFALYSEPLHLEGADGLHTLEFFADDRAGNAEAVERIDLWLDNTAPSVAITRPLPGSVSVGGNYFEAGETYRFITGQLPATPDLPVLPESPVPLPVVDVDREDVTPVAGTVKVEVATSDGDGSGVDRVEYYVDGILRYTADAAPFGWEWDTTVDTLGEHVVTARSIDELGWATDATVVVHVVPAGPAGIEATLHEGVSWPAWLVALVPGLRDVTGLDDILEALPAVPTPQ